MKINIKLKLVLSSLLSAFLFLGFAGTVSAAGEVGISNANLKWSPYNWVSSGTTWKQSPTVGAYLDVAFTGTTLGLNVDSSFVTSTATPANLRITAYIDGNTIPIVRTMADVTSGQLMFSSSLAPGNHYAHIVVSSNTNNSSRWAATSGTPRSTLRITSVQLGATDTTLPLSSTPLAKNGPKILYYGDSITEGNNIGGVGTYGELSHASVLGEELNANYGVHGYGSAVWYFSLISSAPDFHFLSSDTTNYSTGNWRNYYQGESLLNSVANPSSGYKEGIPDAIYNNLGINDVNIYGLGAPFGGSFALQQFEDRVYEWLEEARSAIGARPAIFMVVPFGYNCTQAINPDLNSGQIANLQLYKTTYLDAINTYKSDNQDTRVITIDLGAEGCQVVFDNSTDKLHPNPTGARLLAELIAAESEDQIIPDVPLAATATEEGEVTGTAPRGSTVTVTLQPGGHTCTAVAGSDDEWSCQLPDTTGGSFSMSITADTTYDQTLNYTASIELLALIVPEQVSTPSSDQGNQAAGLLASSGADVRLLFAFIIMLITPGLILLQKNTRLFIK